MPIDSSPSTQRSTRPRRSWGWVGLLIVSVLLHIVLVGWVDGNIGIPSSIEQPDAVITAQLQAAPTIREPSAKPPKPLAKPRRKPAPAKLPKPAIATPEPRIESSPPPPETSPAGPVAATGSSDPVAETPTVAQANVPVAQPAEPEPPPAAEAAEPVELRYKVSPPPSAELKYDVQALREGQTVYGRGKLSWQSEGDRYIASGEAGILFFTVLNFKSEGALDEFGVAPVLYSEKRFRKSETNTHFHRERNTISFSASTASYPRKGGEQDRASIIWQLVGIGRGDSEKFLPGAEIDIFVAGVRDAETWRIQVIGQEDITVGTGKTNAWHVARVPRQGSYDQKIDIWLAPQQEWYPVKLRYTETNGDYLDMLLSNVTLAAAR